MTIETPLPPEPIYIDPELEDLIPVFLENRRKETLELEALVRDRRFVDAAAFGHRLKGTALNFGFNRLGTFGERIEAAGKADDLATLQRILSELRDHLSNIRVLFDRS